MKYVKPKVFNFHLKCARCQRRNVNTVSLMFLKKDITYTDQLLKVCKMLLVNQTSNKMLENK